MCSFIFCDSFIRERCRRHGGKTSLVARGRGYVPDPATPFPADRRFADEPAAAFFIYFIFFWFLPRGVVTVPTLILEMCSPRMPSAPAGPNPRSARFWCDRLPLGRLGRTTGALCARRMSVGIVISPSAHCIAAAAPRNKSPPEHSSADRSAPASPVENLATAFTPLPSPSSNALGSEFLELFIIETVEEDSNVLTYSATAVSFFV